MTAIPVLATRERTRFNGEGGSVHYVFDVLGYDGLSVICIVDPERTDDCQGEPRLITQFYKLEDGREFTNADAAVEAWHSLVIGDEAIDRVAQALRLFTRGLTRTKWSDLCDADKASWRRSAGVLARLLRSVGLELRVVPS